MSDTPKSEIPTAKATLPPKAAGAVPKKPAKKVAKSWPSVNALLTTASITATLGGWAFFTVQEQSASAVEVATVDTPPAIVESVLPTATPVYTLTIELPPIPTVVPRPDFNVASAAPATGNTTNTPIQAPQAPEAPAAAPAIRSVAAPPPAVSAPPAAAPAPAAPAPAATTRSSR